MIKERFAAPNDEPIPVDATLAQNLFRWGVLFKKKGGGFYLNIDQAGDIEEVRVRGVTFLPALLSETAPSRDAVLLDDFFAAYPHGRLGERYRELKSAAPHVHAQDAQNWGHCVHCGKPIEASAPNTDAKLRVVAWLHRRHSTAYVITDSVKQLWLKARPDVVANYTVPLYFGDTLGDEK